MNRPLYQMANELDFLQQNKNKGRGISCVKSIVTCLADEDLDSAKAIVRNEYDKIRVYKDIESYLLENGLCSNIK